MIPIGPWHASSAGRLQNRLHDIYQKRGYVVAGNPVGLGDKSEPQPDITVLRPRSDFYVSAHPEPKDVILLIEISDSTRSFDLVKKRELYAAHGIGEYWVVDGVRKCVHVFRSPRDGEFTDSHVYAGAGEIPLPECEGRTIAAADAGV